MEYNDDFNTDDHVDSYESIELPTKPQTPVKRKVMVQSAVSEEITSKRAVVCSNLVISNTFNFPKYQISV